jgi:hypothetical protein
VEGWSSAVEGWSSAVEGWPSAVEGWPSPTRLEEMLVNAAKARCYLRGRSGTSR